MARVGNGDLQVAFRFAPPITLHDQTCWRTDGNSPVRITQDSAVAYFSWYEPVGHTLWRVGRRDLTFDQSPVAVKIYDDPEPLVGKWIEAIWQAPGGPMHGWFHGEMPVCGAAKLFMPYIGRVLSQDGGLRGSTAATSCVCLPRLLTAHGGMAS